MTGFVSGIVSHTCLYHNHFPRSSTASIATPGCGSTPPRTTSPACVGDNLNAFPLPSKQQARESIDWLIAMTCRFWSPAKENAIRIMRRSRKRGAGVAGGDKRMPRLLCSRLMILRRTTGLATHSGSLGTSLASVLTQAISDSRQVSRVVTKSTTFCTAMHKTAQRSPRLPFQPQPACQKSMSQTLHHARRHSEDRSLQYSIRYPDPMNPPVSYAHTRPETPLHIITSVLHKSRGPVVVYITYSIFVSAAHKIHQVKFTSLLGISSFISCQRPYQAGDCS